MVLHRDSKPKHVNKVLGLGVTVTIISFAFAFVETIWAVYINSFVDNIAWVSIISGIFTLFAFLLFFIFIPYFERHSPIRTYLLSLVIYATTYILFGVTKNFAVFVILALVLTIGRVLRINSVGIMVRNSTSSKKVGETESLIYTLVNIGWLVGPLVTGLFADRWGISSVFFLAAFFVLMSFTTFIFMHIQMKTPKITQIDENILRNFINFFKNKAVVKAYLLRGGLSIFWATTYLFVPLLIIKEGLSNQWIGYFLFAIVVPVVLFEYSLGKSVEKIGYKSYFLIGFGFATIFSLIAGFTSNIFHIMILFILGSASMAFVEPTTESFFFKIIKKKDEGKYYGPFCTSKEVFPTIAKFITAGFLFIFPFKVVFIILTIEMAIMFMISLSLKQK